MNFTTGKSGDRITFVREGSTWYESSRSVNNQPAAYTPTNVSTDRAYDADVTSVDELADVLGTLIADLQVAGVIG